MKQDSILHSISGGWNLLPLVFRSALSGFFVSSVGIACWTLLLKLVPAPFCILPMIIVLWAFWKYYSGSWGSGTNAKKRIVNFRATVLSRQVWKWGLAAAILFVVIVQSSFVVTFRLVEFPSEKFTADYKMLDSMPVWVAWAIITMSSIVAGICEETGFRGYMQVPLEKRYGPAKAIIPTSILFALIHLSHSWALPILPHIFFASVLLGILAYRSGSLIPGIIGHSILDIFDYSVWWSDLTGKFERQTIFRTGVDFHFVIWVLIFLIALLGFFRVLRKMKNSY